jgi:tetratricopeptide (TPR) repeat protein
MHQGQRKPSPRLLAAGLALVSAILLSGTLRAIDWTGLEAVRRLQEEKRYDEAVKRLEAMATRASADAEQFYYLEQAIDIAVESLRDFDRARALARAARDPARRDYADLEVLWRFKKDDEALAAVRGKPIDTWPLDCRGSAHKIIGDLQQTRGDSASALAHYVNAARSSGAPVMIRGRAARQAGMLYLDRGERAPAKAMFRHALTVSPAPYAWRCESLLTLSQMLVEERRAPEAVALFQGVDFTKLEAGHWKSRLLEAYARALLAAGRNIKAVETFDQLLQSGISKNWQARIEKELDKLAEEW